MCRSRKGVSRGAVLAVAMIVAGVGLALPGSAAQASTALPGLEGDGYIVTDGTHHQVFVSGRPSSLVGWSAPLYVVNEEGKSPTSIAVSGAAGMVLSGSTLYVLRCEADEIAIVDTATLAVTGSIALGEDSGYPCDLALAGGRLWFPVRPSGQDAHLASVTVATPHVVNDTAILVNDGLIAPTGGSTLVVYDTGSVMSMDASTATPTGIANRNFATNLHHPVISPDGSLVTAGENLPVMSLPSLTDVPGYPASGDAAALSDGGSWMATSSSVIAVAAKNAVGPINTYPLQAGALAFSPDLSHLYVLVQSGFGAVSLDTIEAPTLPRPGLTLTRSKRTLTAGDSVKLTATLSVPDPAGIVQLLRKSATGALVLVDQGTVGSDHQVPFVIRPKKTTTYVSRFLADSKYGPTTSKSVAVGVHARVGLIAHGWYRTSGKYHLFHYSASCSQHGTHCPSFTASVTPNHAGRRVTFELSVFAGGRWHTVLNARARLGRKSKATIHLRYRSSAVIGSRTRLRAVFPADHDHLAGKSPWSYFKVTG